MTEGPINYPSKPKPDESITYVFVTGCRQATGPEARMLIRSKLQQFDPKNSCLVHGGATGVDAQAADLAGRALGWPGVLVVPARWKSLDRAAGPERNRVMVRMAMIFASQKYKVAWLAFPSEHSRGTWNCVKQAKDARFDVPIFHLKGLDR